MTVLRRSRDLWRRLDVTVRDLPLGLILIVASFLPALEGQETQVGDLPARPFDALAAGVLLLMCLPLAGRRKWPAISLALVSIGFLLSMLGSYHVVAGSAIGVALLSAGAHLGQHRRAAIALLTGTYVVLAFTLHAMGSTEGLDGFVIFYVMLAATWMIGAWLRSTRATEAELRHRIAEDTRTAERTRIARELHDVVTHHVTAMVVQTEAARYLTEAPDRLDQTLSNVSDTGRRAITDLRHLLDLLNPEHRRDDKAPPVGRVLTLVEQARRAGQPVEFVEEGTPAESTGSGDLVAYRVVQEALTNALKYANGSPTSVTVHHGGRDIRVEVGTDGSAVKPGLPDGSGRGLSGLRERVDVLGGDFSADRRSDGGFVVRARIPTGSAS
ncbi:two-component sensor histidine kinase [Spiractinospora alimapuensis]|uniref:sensor histidine kinase n=1 Tax=Spiractinospora alimapuensis TaxID=2820884 RepID=UPI001F33C905|nr:histidine kinase [Spiractinospora alimapuensis]QVQ53968.1 two-component sensor histidine kinase [Spiractinospora alimapuensis]